MRNYLVGFAIILLLLPALTAVASPSWWGLWNTGMGLEQRSLLYGGSNRMCVRLTAQNSPSLVGGQISGVRFYVSDKTAVRSAQVWLSTTVSGEPLMAQEVPLADIRDMAHDGLPTVVALDEPVNVLPAANPYASIFVGFTLELADAPIIYMLAGKGHGASFSNYYNGMDVAYNYGALALQVLADGPAVMERSVALQPIGEQTAVANTDAESLLTLVNEGSEPLSSVGYRVTVDGVAQAERTCLLAEPVTEMGRLVDVSVAYHVPATAEEHTMQVALTSVNGQPLESPSRQAAVLVALDRETRKRTVMEEFTGTWCQNCVRGFVGIERLEQMFGDRFIAIAMHSDDPVLDRDPMTVSHYRNSTFYKTKSSLLGGLPACTIDRWIDGDPYCGYNTSGDFQTDQLVADALSRRAVADIELTACWANEALTAVAYDVATSFRYTSADAHYRLILVLTADSLTGSDSRWYQINGYDDYAGTDEALLQYAGRGHYLTDMVYNHVAADIVGVNDGIEGSISAPIAAGATQHYSYELSTAANTIIQDKQRLHAIAMLIDTRDGSVVNAATASVLPYGDATGIGVASYRQHSPAVYDLAGRRIAKGPSVNGNLPKGLYIVKGRKQLIGR
ncbi:MAG: hypothetical protein IJ637_01020 [Prevotella sp.]|nr:hypothetical protein [Prevotella sp.]